MRNVLISPDGAAQQAGTAVLAQGGNATDAVLAAMLAGATRASPASLLGSGIVVVAGAGVGAHVVDGRARAPGLGVRRPTAPVDPPVAWRAAVPGILEAVLTAHNRFGTAAFGSITRAAIAALEDSGADAGTKARMGLLEALPRTGLDAIERLGILQAIMQVAGPVAAGVITRADLVTVTPPVRALVQDPVGIHELLSMPSDPSVRFAPPEVPALPVMTALCADMHGVIACSVWAVAPEAIALPGEFALSLAALSNAPTKNVTRRRPGSPLPMPTPLVIVRSEGRPWAAAAVSGEGEVEAACRVYVRARLEAAGISSTLPLRDSAHSVRGVVSWVLREQSGDVRSVSEAISQ